jgi:uncharacterized membrane protein YphA (DoxX/SURF4 family)
VIDAIPFAARVVVGVVLIVAGIAKARSRSWPLLAVEMGTPKAVVLTLPAFETLLGLALVLQVGVPVIPWVAVALFVVFSGVVVARYFRRSDLPCNCFGGDGPVTKWTVLRNVALVAVAVLGVS